MKAFYIWLRRKLRGILHTVNDWLYDKAQRTYLWYRDKYNDINAWIDGIGRDDG